MKRIKIVVFLLSCFVLLGFGKINSAQTPNVVIYNDFNFQGLSMALTQNWKGGGNFDRNIRSIRVPVGYRVRMYADKNYRGQETVIQEDWNPGSGTYLIGKIRSIKLEFSGPGSFPTAKGDDILANEQLAPNQSISSQNRRYILRYQTDGNLVLYRRSDNTALWTAKTENKSTGYAVMQADGNFVIYDANRNSLWSTQTQGTGGTRFVVQNDGNLVIYNGSNIAVWNSVSVQTGSVADNFPAIYAGTNFDGAALAVETDMSELADWSGSPQTIRSIRVPQNWYLVLYDKKNFRGKSYNLNSNITFAPGDAWYNKIRSIKVYQGTPPIQPR